MATKRRSKTSQSPATKTPARAPRKPQFAAVFEQLRAILKPYEKDSVVLHDRPGDYYLDSRKMRDGKAVFFAGVTIRGSWVSFYLYPLECFPELKHGMSKALRARLPGTKCFNFTRVDPVAFAELAAITRAGAEAFKTRQIPPKN
jgi:hypothetical protein